MIHFGGGSPDGNKISALGHCGLIRHLGLSVSWSYQSPGLIRLLVLSVFWSYPYLVLSVSVLSISGLIHPNTIFINALEKIPSILYSYALESSRAGPQ